MSINPTPAPPPDEGGEASPQKSDYVSRESLGISPDDVGLVLNMGHLPPVKVAAISWHGKFAVHKAITLDSQYGLRHSKTMYSITHIASGQKCSADWSLDIAKKIADALDQRTTQADFQQDEQWRGKEVTARVHREILEELGVLELYLNDR
jgi:hypothetical protein